MTTGARDQSPFEVLVGDASSLTDWAWRLAGDEPADVRIVRGAKMRTFPAAYDELGAALQLPYYFGENLDALEECLRDLEWLPGSRHLLVVRDADLLLVDERDADGALRSLLRVFAHAESTRPTAKADTPSGGDSTSASFSVALHAGPAALAPLRARLDGAGFSARQQSLP